MLRCRAVSNRLFHVFFLLIMLIWWTSEVKSVDTTGKSVLILVKLARYRFAKLGKFTDLYGGGGEGKIVPPTMQNVCNISRLWGAIFSLV